MNMMKKTGIFICVIALMLGFCSCSDGTHESNLITADLDYSITVPYSEGSEEVDVSFSMPIEQLCTEKYILDMDDDYEEYTIGEDEIILYGENVEQLNGMSFGVRQGKLSEYITDKSEYIETLVAVYNLKYDDDKTVKELKNKISGLIDDYYIISGVITFSGNISEDVKVDSIAVPDLNYEFEFSDFSISTKELDLKTEMKTAEGECFESDGGSVLYSGVAQSNDYFLEGKVLKDIYDVEVQSLSDDCIVINPENYDEVCDKYEFASDIIEIPDNSDNFKKGKSIDENYEYIFTEDVSKKDGIIADILVTMKDSAGNSYWNYDCALSVRDGIYLLASALRDE